MQRKTETSSNVLNIERKLVSEKELEIITGRSARTWQKDRLFGRGPKFYRLNGSVKYKLSEVWEWIEANAVGGGR